MIVTEFDRFQLFNTDSVEMTAASEENDCLIQSIFRIGLYRNFPTPYILRYCGYIWGSKKFKILKTNSMRNHVALSNNQQSSSTGITQPFILIGKR